MTDIARTRVSHSARAHVDDMRASERDTSAMASADIIRARRAMLVM
jgi:hypothetical protein